MTERWLRILKILVPTLGLALLFFWLVETPAGLLGKMDAVGYAVCHRIEARSFHLGDRALPLCARCSGMYLGALLGLLYQLPLRQRSGLPNRKVGFVLLVFLAAFAVDGINSYVHFFPQFPSLYTPSNPLRLLTGSMLGIGLAAVLLPTFRQVAWAEPDPAPVLHSWKQIAALVGLALGLDLLVLWQNPLIEYPLAILSAMTIPLILTLVYTILLLMAFKQENKARTWRDLWIFLASGMLLALLQIGLVDLLRFTFTHSWSGFVIP